jgi:hypothetical protein
VGDGGVDLMADRLRAQEEGYGLEALGWKWHRIDVSNTTIPDEFRMLTKDWYQMPFVHRTCIIARFHSIRESIFQEFARSDTGRRLSLFVCGVAYTCEKGLATSIYCRLGCFCRRLGHSGTWRDHRFSNSKFFLSHHQHTLQLHFRVSFLKRRTQLGTIFIGTGQGFSKHILATWSF